MYVALVCLKGRDIMPLEQQLKENNVVALLCTINSQDTYDNDELMYIDGQV